MRSFICEVEINLPKNKVVDLYSNPDNLSHWQDGFQSLTLLEGTKGTEGAMSEMIYQSGSQKIVMTEIILQNDLPNQFIGEYTSAHTTNIMDNQFIEKSASQTVWKAEINYTRLSFLLRIILLFKKDMFKQQTQIWMNQFKEFAEKQ